MSATLKELKLQFVGIGGLNILCYAWVQIDRVMFFIVRLMLIFEGYR